MQYISDAIYSAGAHTHTHTPNTRAHTHAHAYTHAHTRTHTHTHQAHTESYVGAPMDAIAEEPSGEDSTSNEGSEHNLAEHADSADNIKLQRVTGVSVRHMKPPPASVLKEGWMVHYTNKSTLVSESEYFMNTVESFTKDTLGPANIVFNREVSNSQRVIMHRKYRKIVI